MRRTGLILDECFQRHDTGAGHPESPARLRAIQDALTGKRLVDRCVRLPLREALAEHVHRVHEPGYVERIRTTCHSGAAYIDTPDSAICRESCDLALLAAGSLLEAVDRVMAGEIDNAFCAVRPPGHHALRDLSMGFCLLNNIAIAADHLVHHHAIERVLILDWDVHHGNGTQATFESRPDVLFISLHGHPRWVYPGTSGYANETGVGHGEGYTLNLPMEPGAEDDDYQRAFVESVIPAIQRFQPQFVLVSSGFDAHRSDPLAPINLEDAAFDSMTRVAMTVADLYAGGRMVTVLEGGYDLGVLGRCVASHVRHLLEYAPDDKSPESVDDVW
jgi:acetoin utilization deacetylase AcuC-like enzyme